MSHKRKYQFIDDQAIDDDDIEDQDDSLDDGSEDSLDDFIESEGEYILEGYRVTYFYKQYN